MKLTMTSFKSYPSRSTQATPLNHRAAGASAESLPKEIIGYDVVEYVIDIHEIDPSSLLIAIGHHPFSSSRYPTTIPPMTDRQELRKPPRPLPCRPKVLCHRRHHHRLQLADLQALGGKSAYYQMAHITFGMRKFKLSQTSICAVPKS
jgi:hypothetical protein